MGTNEGVRWVWPGWIAEGKITLLAGDPGVGKSMIALDVAARLSRGVGFPDGTEVLEERGQGGKGLGDRGQGLEDGGGASTGSGQGLDPWADVRAAREREDREEASLGGRIGEGGGHDAASRMGEVAAGGEATVPCKARALGGNVGRTLIFSAEDDWRDTVVPRLRAMGADLEQVSTYGSLDRDNEEWRGFSVRKNLKDLEEWMCFVGNVRLLILDPITACMEGIDQNSTAAVRQHLAPLAHLAARMRVAVLGITHLNKRRRSVDIYRTTGSLAVAAIARAVHFVMPGEDGGPCMMMPMKSNLSASAKPLAYRVAANKVEWLGAASMEKKPNEAEEFERYDRDVAHAYLVESLAGGPQLGMPLIKDAKKLAISERTLRRAKAKLGVKSRKDGKGVWYWELPRIC